MVRVVREKKSDKKLYGGKLRIVNSKDIIEERFLPHAKHELF